MIRQDETGEGYVILREAVDEWGEPTPGRTMVTFGLGEAQIAALRAKFPPGYTLGAAAYEIVARAIEEAQT
jgi:hypothetical protein